MMMTENQQLDISNMTDEQLAQMYESFGFEEEVQEPESEPVVEEVPETTTKLTLNFGVEDAEEGGFELPVLYEAMKEAFSQRIEGETLSVLMARERIFLKQKDEQGIEYGNFNGAGPRAITMYQPEHPDAPKSGRNYGKVFYHWDEERIVPLLDAIFEAYGLDPQVALQEKIERDKAKEEE